MNVILLKRLLLSLIVSVGMAYNLAQAQSGAASEQPRRCAVETYYQTQNSRYSNRPWQRKQFNRQIQEFIRRQALKPDRASTEEAVIRIPVVVHVIHTNASGSIGGPDNANIADEQIFSQIQVLNEDFRRMQDTPGHNTHPAGADMGIEFFLAQTDPDGQATTGITRHYNRWQAEFDILNTTDLMHLSQMAYWPSDRYLNIWVTSLSDNYLGYAQFPSASDFPGLYSEEDERTDGVFIDYRYFGRELGTVTDPIYRLGRTTTHEVGHWLGLIHTWGDAVCGDDYCADTPPVEHANQTLSCTDLFSNCAGEKTKNQIENYMDYTPDACMNLFTQDQRARMRAVLNISPRRRRLVESANLLPTAEQLVVSIQPNPAHDETTLAIQGQRTGPLFIEVLDGIGRTVQTQCYTERSGSTVLLPLHTLTTGMYFVKVRASQQEVIRRLVIK